MVQFGTESPTLMRKCRPKFRCKIVQKLVPLKREGGGGGVQAYNFGNLYYKIRVEGEGQDGFGSMRTILPM